MEEVPTPKKIRRFLIFWVVVTAAFLVVGLVEDYPDFPTNLNRWLIYLLVGPPVWFLVWFLVNLFVQRLLRLLDRLGDKTIRRINIILGCIIAVPITMILVAVIVSLFK